MTQAFWERPDIVARFAEREPDHRLLQLLEQEEAANWRFLDIGCAAGRNTVYLAEHGYDVIALDASAAMVAKTRERLLTVMSKAEASRRVLQQRMEDLGMFASSSFDVVIALGVFQDAQSFENWQQALAESARVLKPGGLCLVAQFAPDHQPHGKRASAVAGTKHVYVGASHDDDRRLVLLDADELDSYAAIAGLLPWVPTEQVRRETEQGYRSTVNALYSRQPAKPYA